MQRGKNVAAWHFYANVKLAEISCDHAASIADKAQIISIISYW